MTQHYSVLLEESINLLEIKPDGCYVDCTFGRGGHARQILSRLGSSGRLIAFDKDLDAISEANNIQDSRFTIIHGSFATIKQSLSACGITHVDGVLADLGVSSPQLDDEGRGFSFRFEAKLDMRMDVTANYSAFEFVNNEAEELIAKVLFEYGEERFARKIAKNIVLSRQKKVIETTFDLADIIRSSIPAKFQDKNPSIRSFQAIRIYVNSELVDLESLLADVPELLNNKGRFVVISFHSLEDRLVKQKFNNLTKVEALPKWVMVDGKTPDFILLVRKIKASEKELTENMRSRSAILRGIEKC